MKLYQLLNIDLYRLGIKWSQAHMYDKQGVGHCQGFFTYLASTEYMYIKKKILLINIVNIVSPVLRGEPALGGDIYVVFGLF